jgi:hypothetical protein
MQANGAPYFEVGTKGAFDCCVCMVTHDSGLRRTPVPGQTVCSGCIQAYIVPHFEEALKHEHSYPVKFGDTELMVWRYKEWLGGSFVDTLRQARDRAQSTIGIESLLQEQGKRRRATTSRGTRTSTDSDCLE